MRRALLAATVLASLWMPAAYADVPVFNAAAIGQLISQLKQAGQAYAVQLQQLSQAAQQVEWTASTFRSLVASPSLGMAQVLLNQVGVSNPLPVDPYTVQNLIAGRGGIPGTLGALSTFANSAAVANRVYAPTDNTWASQQLIANANGIAGAQGIASQVYTQMATRFPVIASLQQDLLGATTPAQREHIMGQIQAQQAWVQQAQGQLQTAEIMLVAERESRAQQIDEHITQSVDNQIAQAKAEGIIP
jgi:hypothetical protein